MFANSPFDMQATSDDSADDKTNTRLEQDSTTNSTTTAGSTPDGAGHPEPSNNRPVSEIISQEFPPFDAETLIIHPIMDEESNDEKFYKGEVR
jgi:hypothetical protein